MNQSSDRIYKNVSVESKKFKTILTHDQESILSREVLGKPCLNLSNSQARQYFKLAEINSINLENCNTFSQNLTCADNVGFNIGFMSETLKNKPFIYQSKDNFTSDGYESQLILNHSVNQALKHRTSILNKNNSTIVNRKEECSHFKIKNQPNPQNQTQQILSKQKLKKIDRLEEYLTKIKSQRFREQIPKSKVKKQLKFQDFKEPFYHCNKINSIQFEENLIKLKQIKLRLNIVRNHALEVKNKNSLSKYLQNHAEIFHHSWGQFNYQSKSNLNHSK